MAVLSPDLLLRRARRHARSLLAPGFKSLTVKCWKGGGGFGADSTVATVALDRARQRHRSCSRPIAYPHGPITVRISGDTGIVKDNCYLQLYNKGGARGTRASRRIRRRRPRT